MFYNPANFFEIALFGSGYARLGNKDKLDLENSLIDQCIDCIRIINGGWNGSTFDVRVIDPLIKDNRTRQTS